MPDKLEWFDQEKIRKPRRTFFGGSPTVRYGLVVVMLMFIFLKFYPKMYEGQRLGGPIDDFFRKKYTNMLLVFPTGGNAADSVVENYTRRVAVRLGEKLSADIPVRADKKVSARTMRRKSLLLYGPLEHNLILNKTEDKLPIRFRDGYPCRADGSVIAVRDWRLIFLAPNPENRTQYFLIYTAATPEQLVGINFMGSPNYVPHDTTDYVLAAGDSVLAAGFFDKDSSGVWSLPPGALDSAGR